MASFGFVLPLGVAALVPVFALPDRLPSLILLVGFWVPAAVAGWAAASYAHRPARAVRAPILYAVLAAFVLAWSAAWFLVQIDRMPPYIPGATHDPREAPPRAITGLALVAAAVVLPGSALACGLAFRRRRQSLRPGPAGSGAA